MSGTFSPSIRIGRRLTPTNSGASPTNGAGLTYGDDTGAFTASQEFWIFQPTAAAGNQPFYEVGLGGTSFVGGNISIPNPGATSAQTIATIPAGSRIQNINLNLLQAPTAITGGSLTFSINGTAIGTVSVGAGLGNGAIVWGTTLAGLRLAAYVGATPAVLTATLAGTAITGGILAEISVNYTAKNVDGSIRGVGVGTTNSGANAPVNNG